LKKRKNSGIFFLNENKDRLYISPSYITAIMRPGFSQEKNAGAFYFFRPQIYNYLLTIIPFSNALSSPAWFRNWRELGCIMSKQLVKIKNLTAFYLIDYFDYQEFL
jgi:hypothetical protein